jgi:hypothetical protein
MRSHRAKTTLFPHITKQTEQIRLSRLYQNLEAVLDYYYIMAAGMGSGPVSRLLSGRGMCLVQRSLSVWQRHVFGSEEFVCLAEACVWFRGVRSVNNWKPVVNTSFCLDLMILDKKNNRRPSLSVIACAQTACLGSFP